MRLTIIFSLSLFCGSLSWAQAGKNSLTVTNLTDMFNLPGYTRESAAQTPKEVRPEFMGSFDEGEKLKFLGDYDRYYVDGQGVQVFLKVQFNNTAGEARTGWVNASHVNQIPGEIQKQLSMLESNIKWDSLSEDCNVCGANNSSYACQSGLLENFFESILNMPNNFKSSNELDKYFEMYRRSCGAHNNYMYEYKRYIQRAAKDFQVPEALLACVIFTESQFKPNQTSPVGAVGLAQIMPDAAEVINDAVVNGELTVREVNKWSKIANDYEKKIEKGERVSVQETKDYNFARKRLFRHDLHVDWDDYFSEMVSDPIFKKAGYTKYGDNGQPTRFSTEIGAKKEKAPFSIAGSALYLKYTMFSLAQRGASSARADQQDSMVNFYAAIGGAYNMGAGSANRFIKRKERKLGRQLNTQEWVDAMNRYDETKNYMESLKRCMKKGDERPPSKNSRLRPNKTSCQVIFAGA